MCEVNYIHADGTPVQTGNCVVVDNRVQSYRVNIRTMGTVTEETIKRLLQNALEVVSVQKLGEIIVIR